MITEYLEIDAEAETPSLADILIRLKCNDEPKLDFLVMTCNKHASLRIIFHKPSLLTELKTYVKLTKVMYGFMFCFTISLSRLASKLIFIAPLPAQKPH